MSEYRSSVLQVFDSAEHCQVCAFIAGSRKESDMLETIRVLDQKLHENEVQNRRLSAILADVHIAMRGTKPVTDASEESDA